MIDDGTIFRAIVRQQRQGQAHAQQPRVRITPSDSLGRPQGMTLEGRAKRVDGDEEIRISQLLYRKYGLMKMSFDLWGAIKQFDWAVFAIEV